MSSGEQMIDVGGGISLCYERLGSSDDPAILLIMGLGQQLLAWPDDFCQALVDRGFQVVRFDNRDIGRSTHATTPSPSWGRLLTRRLPPDQYEVSDMARDAAGLIGALALGPAHAVGVSMGGMIAQMLAAQYPQDVRSLVSIMSSTGARNAGWVAPSTLRLMFRAPPRDREAAAERSVLMFSQIGSHGFPFDDEFVRNRARRAFDRDPRAAIGTARQLGAIIKSGDRTAALQRITAPTLVIHGDRDRMVHPSGGRATARAIPGARLVTIPGLGHDIPVGVYGQMIDLIAEHALSVQRIPADGSPGEAPRAASA
jgi:pimeloyl-ACP methyl ester carboxylesterase